MSKNYIEMFMKDNGLKYNEKINVSGSLNNPCVIVEGNLMKDCNGDFANHELISLLDGIYQIEKIKPKTLKEKLKEQDYGWYINYTGVVYRTTVGDMNYETTLEQGNVFLNKSEAEREVYRRKLEFEMQEWAREKECLSDCFGEQAYQGINVYININEYTHDNMKALKNIFSDKVDKYYNWK